MTLPGYTGAPPYFSMPDTPAPFSLVGATSHGFSLKAVSNTTVRVDWGDGTFTVKQVGASNVTFSHTYSQSFTGEIKISEPSRIKEVANFTGNLSSVRWTTQQMSALRALSSIIANQTQISGDIADLPAPLTYAYFSGAAMTLSGDIADLPAPLATAYFIGASMTLSGDIADLPAALATAYFNGASMGINDYTGPISFSYGLTRLELISSAPNGLASSEVDQLIIDFAAVRTANNGVLSLPASNAPRTAASDAAVASLVSAGWTVVTA